MPSSRSRIAVRTCLALACGLAAAAVLPARAQAAETVFQDDLETDPRGVWGNANQTGLNSWTTDDAFSPTHSLRVHTQHWYTPIIPLEPFGFYSVEFKAKTTGRGMWGPLDDPFSEYVNTGEWEHNAKIFRNNPGIDWTQVIFRPTNTLAPVYFDDVAIKRLTSAEAAAMQDQFFATMPSFTFTPPANRHTHIPEAIRKLKGGEELKIVMLGDSIVNDMSRGYFEPLVERKYPGAQLQVVTSTRNATGMWWYKEENRLQSYVLDHEPDLVMLGGISHLGDIESVREVIRQVRAASPDTEFILMSEAAGYDNPLLKPGMLDPVNPTEPGWKNELYCLAVQENVEFLDMTRPWAQYIVNSGEAYDYFLRDAIHMNARGSQIAGRILEAYFTPVINPEPGALSLLALGALSLLRRRQ